MVRYELDSFNPYLIEGVRLVKRVSVTKTTKNLGRRSLLLQLSIALIKLIREGEPPGSRSEAVMTRPSHI